MPYTGRCKVARDHKTKNKPKPGGVTHTTKHIYKDSSDPGHRRSHDRQPDGTKTNDHQVDQQTGRKLNIQTGKVTGGNKK